MGIKSFLVMVLVLFAATAFVTSSYFNIELKSWMPVIWVGAFFGGLLLPKLFRNYV